MPLSLDGKSIFVDTSKIDPIKPTIEWNGEVEWRYQENIRECEAAYMTGSGHVDLALADMLNYFDPIRPFQISASGVLSKRQNVHANHKIVCSYFDLGQHVPSG